MAADQAFEAAGSRFLDELLNADRAAADGDAAALKAARAALQKAKTDRDAEKKRREALKAAATTLDPKLLKQVVDQLLAVPVLKRAPAIPRSFVEEAVQQAHKSRWQAAAWSAVFVVSCVRVAAIASRLEPKGGYAVPPKGRDVPILWVTARHWEYVVKAREHAKAKVPGTYHAVEPKQHPVRVGDIIVTDRVLDIGTPVTLPGLGGGSSTGTSWSASTP